MKRYTVTYEVRTVGAIGIFEPASVTLSAENPVQAANKAFEMLHQEGYETNGILRVREVIDEEQEEGIQQGW